MICLQAPDFPPLDTLGRLLGQWESSAENAHFMVTIMQSEMGRKKRLGMEEHAHEHGQK